MRYVLVQVRRLLYEHPKVETEGARTVLFRFDESAMTMEIFCYILTRDDDEFLAIREDLLLRIMDVVDAAGTGFAFPSQTLYLGRDTGCRQGKGRTCGPRGAEMAGKQSAALSRLSPYRHFRDQQFSALSAARFGSGKQKGSVSVSPLVRSVFTVVVMAVFSLQVCSREVPMQSSTATPSPIAKCRLRG